MNIFILMVADFMVLRVLSLSSFMLCFALVACYQQSEKSETIIKYNAGSVQLENRNGTMYLADTLFTGMLYRFFRIAETLQKLLVTVMKKNMVNEEFYSNKQPKQQRYFDNGIKVKDLAEWWENGQLKTSCNFKEGEYEGVFRQWNEQGVLIKEMTYKNGYEEGSQKMFYDNGKIRSNYVVKNGKRTGVLGTKNCINVSDSIFKK